MRMVIVARIEYLLLRKIKGAVFVVGKVLSLKMCLRAGVGLEI